MDFWVRGLGFFELFAIPGRLVHLRRWAFQDVLLVPAASVPEQAPPMSFSFACVTTPENARIVFTAAEPFDTASQEARNLEAVGITAPGTSRGDNGEAYAI